MGTMRSEFEPGDRVITAQGQSGVVLETLEAGFAVIENALPDPLFPVATAVPDDVLVHWGTDQRGPVQDWRPATDLAPLTTPVTPEATVYARQRAAASLGITIT